MTNIYVGCSGYLYDHWKGIFYPADLPKKLWFQYYTRRFWTIELDVTFDSLPNKETLTRWYEESPPGFLFSVRGSRFITHVKKLKAAAESIDVFFSRVSALKEKLGVILWQLPPGLQADPARLADFLDILKPYGVRSAFEFIESTDVSKKMISVLERGRASLCVNDWPQAQHNFPSHFLYIRKPGEDRSTAAGLSPEELKTDAARIRKYRRQGMDIFFFFTNNGLGSAPKNASELILILRKKSA